MFDTPTILIIFAAVVGSSSMTGIVMWLAARTSRKTASTAPSGCSPRGTRNRRTTSYARPTFGNNRKIPAPATAATTRKTKPCVGLP